MHRVRFEGIEAVLFDFEGTLVDSQWNNKKAVLDALAGLRNLGISTDRLEGNRIAALMNEAMASAPDYGRTPGEVKNLFGSIYDRYDEDALARWSLRPHSKQFLHTLRFKGIKRGMVSNAGRSILKKALERLGLEGLFDVIVSRDDVERAKPSAEGIESALRSLHVSKTRVFYIGDTPEDVRAARAAGITIGIIQAPENPSGPLASVIPDFTIQSFGELLDELRKDPS